MRGRSKVSPASEEEAEMCALARTCSSSLLLNAQLQLPLDVVVDSALDLVDVVLVVVVGVVLRPLRAPRRDCRVQTRGSLERVGATVLQYICTHSLITTTLLFFVTVDIFITREYVH